MGAIASEIQWIPFTKGQVTRKKFQFDDAIMKSLNLFITVSEYDPLHVPRQCITSAGGYEATFLLSVIFRISRLYLACKYGIYLLQLSCGGTCQI